MTGRPQDLEVELPDRPGALADLGEALGAAGVSLEGGGVTTVGDRAVAHFLVLGGEAAVAAVAGAGLGRAVARDVLTARLAQDVPGQLGALARRLGDADVSVRVQYSDHAGNLVLLVDDADRERARAVVARWRPGDA
ncbi:ACT domain-containing protein [Cellulomonas pakistanensis]|uniref:ACT domain-containing protein n=1 Tax=Cellulomonas pakistanensis TaxID=992287 RepID=A0A919P6E5_9CELL|nr:ACT domain-containing protein [Cellulomonas pakistanensis]GIG34941.1 hypothetical protein Cpa01nite_03220 [Cellulomonas pakistanensis]